MSTFLLDTAMSWDFFVPVSVGDLVKTGGINQYVVQDVVPPKHLPSSINSEQEDPVMAQLLGKDFVDVDCLKLYLFLQSLRSR